MSETLRHVPDRAVITGWDFSTSGVKCLAFDLDGNTLAEVRLPTDLWTKGGVSELNLLQLEGQARASVRAMARQAARHGPAAGLGRRRHLGDAPHRRPHRRATTSRSAGPSAGTTRPWPRITPSGLERLGGQKKVRELIGGPWAIRYTLSHLVKDEVTLERERLAAHGRRSCRTARSPPAI